LFNGAQHAWRAVVSKLFDSVARRLLPMPLGPSRDCPYLQKLKVDRSMSEAVGTSSRTARSHPRVAAMAGHRILIVDDDGAQRRALKIAFDRLDWQVREAATVGEALAAVAADPEPCCLILDLMLPDGRGETILEHVRAAGWDTRVVVLTGIVSILRLQALEKLRPDRVVFKPIARVEAWDGPCRVCSRATASTG
jgi:CheY-like chemotaxis protein